MYAKRITKYTLVALLVVFSFFPHQFISSASLIYRKTAAGVATFLGLSDTPSSYSGQAGKYTRVNATEDGLEFGTPAGSNANEKIEFIIDGRGQAIQSNASGHRPVGFDCTITAWEVVSNVSGSIVVDIKKSTYAAYAVFNSIAGTEKPTLSAAQKNTDTNLTSFSTSISKGDRIQAVVDSVDINGVVVVTLYVTKT